MPMTAIDESYIRSNLRDTLSGAEVFKLKLLQWMLLFLTFSETITDASRKLLLAQDCALRLQSTGELKLIAWIILFVAQVGAISMTQMLSVFYICYANTIFQSLNDTLGILVLAAIQALGSKFFIIYF